MRALALNLVVFMGLSGCASLSRAQLYSGITGQPTKLEQVLQPVRPGTILIVAENHGHGPHHQNQVRVIEQLAQQGFTVSVGMEFFQKKNQAELNQFLSGKLPEDIFLKSIAWGKIPFDNYRAQVLLPLKSQGTTVALNASRELTDKIAKVGIANLSAEEKAQLPTSFTLGNPHYFERFKDVMATHVPESALPRYFEAQSTWDETMAATAVEFIREHPNQVLVIIVGDFHAAFGGGLPDRLLARGAQSVVVISQINPESMSESELKEQLGPHPKWGVRANGVWIQ